jgi:hypothetical protein
VRELPEFELREVFRTDRERHLIVQNAVDVGDQAPAKPAAKIVGRLRSEMRGTM